MKDSSDQQQQQRPSTTTTTTTNSAQAPQPTTKTKNKKQKQSARPGGKEALPRKSFAISSLSFFSSVSVSARSHHQTGRARERVRAKGTNETSSPNKTPYPLFFFSYLFI
jgi:hypothetical protein